MWKYHCKIKWQDNSIMHITMLTPYHPDTYSVLQNFLVMRHCVYVKLVHTGNRPSHVRNHAMFEMIDILSNKEACMKPLHVEHFKFYVRHVPVSCIFGGWIGQCPNDSARSKLYIRNCNWFFLWSMLTKYEWTPIYCIGEILPQKDNTQIRVNDNKIR